MIQPAHQSQGLKVASVKCITLHSGQAGKAGREGGRGVKVRKAGAGSVRAWI
jgi:hypothetical protein